jgi:hypothetical protein
MRIALSLLCIFVFGCGGSRSLEVAFPGAPREAKGALRLVFSESVTDLVVAINGRLVVNGAEARTLRVRGLETGYADVAIAAAGVERQTRVWIESGRTTSLPVASAGPRGSSPLLMGAMSIAALVISRMVDAWIF